MDVVIMEGSGASFFVVAAAAAWGWIRSEMMEIRRSAIGMSLGMVMVLDSNDIHVKYS